MRPTPVDLLQAQRLAYRIAASGSNRVQRIALIGSRARGDAKATSDFDIVVLVEPPEAKPMWGKRENSVELQRIQSAVGPPPVTTDLSVRTTDQFAEAQGTFGSIEWILATEGVELYSRPALRLPVVCRTPDRVRIESVGDWMEDALVKLELAFGGGATGSAVVVGATPTRTAPERLAQMSVEHSLLALFVLHQKPFSTKAVRLDVTLDALRALGERRLAEEIRRLAVSLPSAQAARTIVSSILYRLDQELLLRHHVRDVLKRLRIVRPLVTGLRVSGISADTRHPPVTARPRDGASTRSPSGAK